ncbi:M20 family metallo-hydrolase [Lagierella sp.]|uniref:M20 family metallo-hydrolase n=1 Tax=Lagierella sp. TaxID=2849657 RepID=UPI002609ED71|nr:M20 family metallo-hydrolase [Lagierella sp.]
MKVDGARIAKRIEEISKFNSTKGEGVTRFSYSKEDEKARDWIGNILDNLNMDYSVDSVGNLRARYEGKSNSLPPLLIGSHIDSVKNGGKYDGVLGVIGALEVLNVMKENNYIPNRPVELIIFSEEEGSNFGTTMVGSKALTGKLNFESLSKLENSEGKSAVEVLKDFGLDPKEMKKHVLKPEEIFCMLELHIEQGIVLENQNKQIGIVEAIAGMITLDVTVKGEENHAGSTPMNMRKDALVIAADLIKEIENIAKYKVEKTTVATVGKISSKPNMANVIPGEVRFTVDIRDINQYDLEKAETLIRREAKRIENEKNFEIAIKVLGASDPVGLSPSIVDIITNEVKSLTDSWMKLHSGAVHDAAMMADITPTGMIFVPSVLGKSHTKEEFTKQEDIKLGVQALLNSVIKLSNE